jgi:hypothetical protein
MMNKKYPPSLAKLRRKGHTFAKASVDKFAKEKY